MKKAGIEHPALILHFREVSSTLIIQ